MFSFQNKLANIVDARWQLSSQPMPSNDLSINFAGFLGSGTFLPPTQAKAKVVSVNWKHLVAGKRIAGTKYFFPRGLTPGGAQYKPGSGLEHGGDHDQEIGLRGAIHAEGARSDGQAEKAGVV